MTAKTAKKTATMSKPARRRSVRHLTTGLGTPGLSIRRPPTGSVVSAGRVVPVTIVTDSPTLTFTLTPVDAAGNIVTTIPIDNTLWMGTPATQTVPVPIPPGLGLTYTLWLEATDPTGTFAHGITLNT